MKLPQSEVEEKAAAPLLYEIRRRGHREACYVVVSDPNVIRCFGLGEVPFSVDLVSRVRTVVMLAIFVRYRRLFGSAFSLVVVVVRFGS